MAVPIQSAYTIPTGVTTFPAASLKYLSQGILSDGMVGIGATTNEYASQWGAAKSLILRPVAKKLHIRQKTCLKVSPYTPLVTNEFWVPVFEELDPVFYGAGKYQITANSPWLKRGTLWPLGQTTYWIPSAVSASGTITNWFRLGNSQNMTSLSVSGPAFASIPDNGWTVGSDASYNYKWSAIDSAFANVALTSAETAPPVTKLGDVSLGGIFKKGALSPYNLQEYQASAGLKTLSGTPVTPFTVAGVPGSTTGYAFYWSPFFITVANIKLPIFVTNDTLVRIQAWRNQATHPVAPATIPLSYNGWNINTAKFIENADAPGNDGIPEVLATAIEITEANFDFLESWTEGANLVKKNLVVTNPTKWMVLPRRYKVGVAINSGFPGASKGYSSGVFGTQDIAVSATKFGFYNPANYPPAFNHFGIFNTQSHATAYANYINNLMPYIALNTAGPIDGFIQKSTTATTKVSFDPRGLYGIPDGTITFSNLLGGAPVQPQLAQTDIEKGLGLASGGKLNYDAAVMYLIKQGSATLNLDTLNTLLRMIDATDEMTDPLSVVKTRFLEQIRLVYANLLGAQGVTGEMLTNRVNALMLAIGTAASSGGSGGSGRSGGSGGSGGVPRQPGGGATPATESMRIRLQARGLAGYIKPTGWNTTSKPTLVQQYSYTKTSKNTAGQEQLSQVIMSEPLRYEFPYIPINVQYSGLGAQWTEIERKANFPIVDFQSFQLLKISFNFDVADGDGLFTSVDNQLTTLRKMAQAPYPVTLYNMDAIVSEELRYPLFTRGRGVEFVISDFSISSTQRTPGSPSHISRATCSMTLQEIPIEEVSVIFMPPITPCKKVNCPPPSATTCIRDCTEQAFMLFSPLVNGVSN